jgi:hypothetical protein
MTLTRSASGGQEVQAPAAHLIEAWPGPTTFEHSERMVRGRTTLDEVLGQLLRAIGALPYRGEGTTVSP